MKIVISEAERGILYKHGVYRRLLQPGRHRVWTALGEAYSRLHLEGALDVDDTLLSILKKDPAFEKNAVVIDVPDGKLAVHFVDGRIRETLKPGAYAFWNVYKKHTFELLDITVPDAANAVPAPYMAYMPPRYCVKADVGDGEAGLLFYNGVYQRALGAGQYYFWNYNTSVTVQTVDMRAQQLDIPGQEILTADKVSLRVNFVCSYRVTDPVGVITRLKDYKTQLHVLVQLALREYAGKYRFDELLRQKDSVGGIVLERLREREGGFYVTFLDAGVKDIILPGEIRDIMNTVLVAEKTAQAAVIARREETAATRSLLDTARLMDENATLYRLKELEYLERVCDRVGSISVDAGGGVLKGLRELISGKG